MKILVTGGAGFQGSHLVELLFSEGYDDVTVLNTLTEQAVRNLEQMACKPRVVWGSVTDSEVVSKTVAGKDVVFHLAAHINVDESRVCPRQTFEVNLGGTCNILEAARACGARVIYSSSCEVYGTPAEIPIKESAELRPASPYAASKVAADRLCFAYASSYGLNVQIIRLFNVYGRRQKEGRYGAVIPIFVSKGLKGETLEVFGNGLQSRDYVHVFDAAEAYRKVLTSDCQTGEVINFATGVGTKIGDIAEAIAKSFGVKVNYIEPRPGEVTDMIGDNTKAIKLGWVPSVDIWEGLTDYISWRKQTLLLAGLAQAL